MLPKRGFGHIEAVLTLVIFMGFLIFAFTFFNPLRTSRTLTSTLDYAWREVTDYTQSTIDSYSVVLDPTTPALVALAVPGAPDLNATVHDGRGMRIPSFTDAVGVHFQKPSDHFVTLLYSTYFDAGDVRIAGSLVPTSNYIISSFDTTDPQFETLFLDLNTTYHTNYTGLKKQFNLPNRVDFGFSVTSGGVAIITATQEIPANFEVLSKHDRVPFVRSSSGALEYAEVVVFVW